MVVDHYDADWARLWWVRVDGTAAVHEGGELRERALDALAAKYPPYAAARPADRWSCSRRRLGRVAGRATLGVTSRLPRRAGPARKRTIAAATGSVLEVGGVAAVEQQQLDRPRRPVPDGLDVRTVP